jgi:hypothetical protein
MMTALLDPTRNRLLVTAAQDLLFRLGCLMLCLVLLGVADRMSNACEGKEHDGQSDQAWAASGSNHDDRHSMGGADLPQVT